MGQIGGKLIHCYVQDCDSQLASETSVADPQKKKNGASVRAQSEKRLPGVFENNVIVSYSDSEDSSDMIWVAVPVMARCAKVPKSYLDRHDYMGNYVISDKKLVEKLDKSDDTYQNRMFPIVTNILPVQNPGLHKGNFASDTSATSSNDVSYPPDSSVCAISTPRLPTPLVFRRNPLENLEKLPEGLQSLTESPTYRIHSTSDQESSTMCEGSFGDESPKSLDPFVLEVGIDWPHEK